jgi:hypothetical protein
VPESWSREEVEAAVSDYFSMLSMELRGQAYNKAEHNRTLHQLLNHRPHGSIERKHQNISAILIEEGYPYIDGYKPLVNYQALLRIVVEERLTCASELNQTVASVVESPAVAIPEVGDLLSMQVEPQTPDEREKRVREEPIGARSPVVQRNYLEIEARNRSLGRAGEELALRFERERLTKIGKTRLANDIRHVSALEGDHLGYDILSFEPDGAKRLIEVKTTRFGVMTPFFASRNEVNVSSVRQSEYQLYRLFNFRAEPRLYTLHGSLRQSCRLDAVTYSAFPV